MNSKKIAVWGKSGSGKTTLAVNLALALSARNYLTGLVSCNLQYADIQAHFGQTIFEGKGIFNALQDSTGSVHELFWKSGQHDNLFILCVPNRYSGLETDSVTLEQAENLFAGCEIHFDYLIIDGKEDITNPVSSVGLAVADKILTLYRPSVVTCLWQNGMEQFTEQLHIKDKIAPILNANQNDCADFLRNIGLDFAYDLPYVKTAQAAENAGKPLYMVDDMAAKRYAKAVDKIADSLCGK